MSRSEPAPVPGRSMFYQSEAGRELHRLEFFPRGEPRGGVVLVHGLGDHISRYDEIGNLFASRGLHVVGVDFPGHGSSPGIRGHLGNWRDVELIMREMIACVRERTGDSVPLGMMAHSMGAFIALKFLEISPGSFEFAWLSSPLIRPGAHRGPAVRGLARAVARVLPWLTVDSGVREEKCHPIGEVGRDPRWHHRVSLGWGGEMLRLEEEIANDLVRLNPGLALLVTHGDADLVCPASDSRELFDRIAVRDKQYVSVDEMMHDPFRGETHRAEVFAAVGRWLDERGFAPVNSR